MNKAITFATATSLLVMGVGSSQAADLRPPIGGPFTDVYAFSSIPGSGNGVNVKIVGGTAFFDFIPDGFGADGQYDVDLATGAFAEFGSVPGLIKDVSLPFPLAPNAPVAIPITTFLNLDGVAAPDSVFDLTTAFGPVFTTTATGTTISFDFAGVFKQTAGDIANFNGSGTISATFIGLAPEDIIELAQRPEGITSSQSGTFTLRAEAVPEPSALVSLAAFAGAGTLLNRKRKNK
ncbi:PEP-CTERM sorting domain-containing protein [Crocosphaera sp. UHCC 0190]|uniref:PEP-CTERM sorting domain-containing protein n=1 Tax=Crocosphaera sp. UHCC 0190 TaxID=3110246 RepID=UPI002B20F2A4|nr:PEP-CTERM sorting domain-containing protein [Crocosphaera sp. UHCC 0190]MEA5509997.1 PEP-CTERM sorting domain-containing protein [Crocosphaera sp. UHCC 0190]